MIYASDILNTMYLVSDRHGNSYQISATRVEADIEHGIVLFYNGKSADTMFRLEDVKRYARVVYG